MAKRIFLIVLDSFGIGAEPDAPAFGDAGTNTLGLKLWQIKILYNSIFSGGVFMRKTKIVCTLGPSTDQPGILPSGQLLLAVLEFAQADLRAFGIQHCRNGNVKLFAQCAQLIQTAFVFRVIAMRKIEACNIHPVFQQLAQNAGLCWMMA